MNRQARARELRLLIAARKVLERLTRDDGASATGEFAKALERLQGAVNAYGTGGEGNG